MPKPNYVTGAAARALPDRSDLRSHVVGELRKMRLQIAALENLLAAPPISPRQAAQRRAVRPLRPAAPAPTRVNGVPVAFPTPCTSCEPYCGPYCECSCHRKAARS